MDVGFNNETTGIIYIYIVDILWSIDDFEGLLCTILEVYFGEIIIITIHEVGILCLTIHFGCFELKYSLSSLGWISGR